MLKKYKQVVLGFVIGSVLTLTGTAFANPSISATLASWVKFTFDGVEKPLPQGYTVLIYNDRTYVPARFVAEQLGANVDWDDKTKTILIKKEPSLSPGTTPLTDQQPEILYESLPASQTVNGVRVEAYSVSAQSDRTTFYLRVKNTTDKPMQLDQELAYFVADGEMYRPKDVDEDIFYKKDKTWYNDIREDETKEGFVLLPALPKGTKQGTLYLKLIQNDGSQKTSDVVINLKW